MLVTPNIVKTKNTVLLLVLLLLLFLLFLRSKPQWQTTPPNTNATAGAPLPDGSEAIAVQGAAAVIPVPTAYGIVKVLRLKNS